MYYISLFHVLAIVNREAMSVAGQIPLQYGVKSTDCMPQKWCSWAGPDGHSSLNFY